MKERGLGRTGVVVLLLIIIAIGAVAYSDPSLLMGGDNRPAENTAPPENETGPTQTTDENLVTVTDVVDGDTIDVSYPGGGENRVRLLGVDTPETHGSNEPEEYEGVTDPDHLREWGYKASDHAKSSLLGEGVSLRYDDIAGRTGYYGRTLAYVIVNGTNFNLDLVRNGYARAYTESNNELYENFVRAEEEAKDEGKGLWIALDNRSSDSNVHISLVHEDASGDEYGNLNDEYVEVKNGADSTVDMTDWTLSDEADHVYHFSEDFTLSEGATVTVHSGSGTDTSTDLYWGSDDPIWNNSGDTAYLKNGTENLADREEW